MTMPFDGDFIIFDTETTGLTQPSAADISQQPFITELYGIRIDKDWNMVSEFETFVKPPIPIPEEVVKITSITDEMVKDAPSFIQIFDELAQFFLGAETAVAHNATFDLEVLQWELTRHGLEYKFPWPPRNDCTIELSFPIENKSLKLSRLHEIATGRPHFDGAHRAKNDVMATVRCYKWLSEKGFVK